MSRITAFLKKELLEVIPPTMFFMAVFNLVVFTRSVIGESAEVSMKTYGAAAFGALVVGKAILIADATPLFRWFSENRLILNVAWRTGLYLLVVLVFQLLEELIPLVSQHGGVGAAVETFVEETHWATFWATHLVLGMFLGCYALGSAMIGVIGKERFVQVFFGR